MLKIMFWSIPEQNNSRRSAKKRGILLILHFGRQANGGYLQPSTRAMKMLLSSKKSKNGDCLSWLLTSFFPNAFELLFERL